MVTPLVERRLAAGDLSLNLASSDETSCGVLFLHGVMRRWQTFAPLYAAMGQSFQVGGLDLPGHGRSDRWPGHYRVTDHVAAVAALLRAKKGLPVILYGHSLGAMVALGVAAAVPDRVRAAVLEDPPFETMGTRIEATPWYGYFAAIHRLVSGSDFRSLTIAEQSQRLGDVEVPDAGNKPRPLREMRDAGAIRFLASCLRHMDPEALGPVVAGRWLEGFDWQAAARSVEAPLLVLQADPKAGGTLIDADAATLASLTRDATLITLRGSGHNLHLDRTQDVVNHTLGFINTLRQDGDLA